MQSITGSKQNLTNHKRPGILNRFVFGGAVCMISIFFLACGKPFNVQPRPKVTTANYQVSAQANGVTIDAEALTDEDRLYDQFEANLTLAGVLAVRVRLANMQTEAVELKKARFAIRAQNQTFKSIEAKSAYKRLMKYYSITIYNKAGYKESRDDFSTYEINLKNRLAANDSREGLIFFAVPDDIIKSGELILAVEKLSPAKEKGATPVELKLK